MPFYALFMVDGTTGWDEQSDTEQSGLSQLRYLLLNDHPVGVECLHIGDDSITGGSFTVAALR